MQSIGEILKKERLEKDLTLDQVAEITKISKSVLQQVEDDDFSSFPAEMYVQGFLVNICECYGIQSSDVVRIRKNRGSDEEILTGTQKKSENIEEDESIIPEDNNKKKIMILALIIGVLVIIGAVILVFITRETTIIYTNTENELSKNTVYRLNGDKELFDLVVKDEIKIFHDSGYYHFVLHVINEESISFSIENANFRLSMGETLPVDLDKDDTPDVELHLRNISGELARLFIQRESTGGNKIDYQQLWDNEENVYVGKEFVLLEKQDKLPLELFIKAQQLPSQIQYIVDGKQMKSTRLNAGQGEFVLAEESIEITIGNYQSVQFFINKIPINLTMEHSKYSVTKIIKWVRYPYNETKFDLIIKDYVN